MDARATASVLTQTSRLSLDLVVRLSQAFLILSFMKLSRVP